MLFVQFEGVHKFAGILSAERSSSQIRLCEFGSAALYPPCENTLCPQNPTTLSRHTFSFLFQKVV